MKIIVQPLPSEGEEPTVTEIEDTLEAMQAVVGGLIEIVTLDDGYLAVVNEDGLFLGLEQNGPFSGVWFICRCGPEGEIVGLTDEDIAIILGLDEEVIA